MIVCVYWCSPIQNQGIFVFLPGGVLASTSVASPADLPFGRFLQVNFTERRKCVFGAGRAS